MERIGCGIWLLLFVGLPFYGLLLATRQHRSVALGMSCGIVASLALISGYAALLSIIDLRRRRQILPENDVPRWVVPLVWVVFVSAAIGCAALFRRF